MLIHETASLRLDKPVCVDQNFVFDLTSISHQSLECMLQQAMFKLLLIRSGYVSFLLQSATEDMVANIFGSFPGMEYCDLKRDRITGLSKVIPNHQSLHLYFACLIGPMSCAFQFMQF